jgi:DNA-binding YbaB/EbfC family protein
MFRGIGNIANLLGNARHLQERMAEMQSRLSDVRVEGAAGGGMVRATANGKLEIVAVNIEESIFVSGDREMLEELVQAAVATALRKAREAAASQMHELAGGLPIPGLSDVINRFGGNSVTD